MMKKILSALVCAAVVLSLAGCGSENPLTSDMLNPQASKVNGSSSANTSAANKPDMWDVIPEIPVTDESAFEYRYDSNMGGMVITNYLKESPKVRIPDTLEGEPVVEVDFSELEKELTQLIMPDSVKEFCLFGQSALQYVNVPQSVTWIGSDAFEYCKSLTSITIPASVTEITTYFKGCESLTSINVDDGNLKFFSVDGMLCKKGGNKAPELYACPEGIIGSITIPDSVTVIGERAFEYCKNLTSVTIPDNVTEIGASAFKDCEKLIGVTIGNGLTDIGESAFNNCTSLMDIIIPDSVTTMGWAGIFQNCINLESVTIGKSVTEITRFENCTSLKNITIPNSVTKISTGAFKDCLNLTDATYKGKTYDYEHINMLYDAINLGESGLLIEDGVLKDVSCELMEVVIPDGVTEIGTGAFSGCINLTSITIPDSVLRIEDKAFRGCTNLKSVTIPNSDIYIGRYVFQDCTSLTNVTIPDNETIVAGFFKGCSSLTNITIPNNVTMIYNDSFEGCINVKVTYKGKTYSYYQIESLYSAINL